MKRLLLVSHPTVLSDPLLMPPPSRRELWVGGEKGSGRGGGGRQGTRSPAVVVSRSKTRQADTNKQADSDTSRPRVPLSGEPITALMERSHDSHLRLGGFRLGLSK